MHSFYTKIVGSTFCGGQEHIKTLKQDDVVKLIREPTNTFDPNAIGVHKLIEGEPRMGYLPKDTAEELAKLMDAGTKVSAIVTDVTGGGGDRNVGCNLEVFHE